jgi:anti-sigma B factor antagonist
MTVPGNQSYLDIRACDGVTVVTFMVPELLEDELIDVLGMTLRDRVEHQGDRRLILNFSAVTFMNSDMLGVLLGLLKQVNTAGGRLALCAFNQRFREMMATLKLNRVFNIYESEMEALESFVH